MKHVDGLSCHQLLASVHYHYIHTSMKKALLATEESANTPPPRPVMALILKEEHTSFLCPASSRRPEMNRIASHLSCVMPRVGGDGRVHPHW